MSKDEQEFDAGKHMDRPYFETIGGYFQQAAIQYSKSQKNELYSTLHNIYGMLSQRSTKKYDEEIETLFKGVKEGTSKTPLYDLWKVRRLLVSAMDDNSMLYNRWVRKEKKNIVV